jgi:hypothetical protein
MVRGAAAATMAAAMWLWAAPGAAQAATDVRLRFTGRMQAQFNTTSVDDDEVEDRVASSTFEARRVRLAAEVTVREWIVGVVEADYANAGFSMKRAFVDLGFDEAIALRVGQFKRPFSRIFLTSSLETPVIERGLRLRGLSAAFERSDAAQPMPVLGPEAIFGDEFAVLDGLGHVDYELGAAIHGELGRFGYEAGVFNGTGEDGQDANDAKSFAGRVMIGMGELPLSVGGAVSYREMGVGDESVGGAAFALDAVWGAFRRAGLRVLIEGSAGENYFVDETFLAAQVMTSWYYETGGARVEGVEGAARVSWGDPDREVDGDAGVLLTPGFNLYFMGRNRLSVNWDVFVPQDDRFSTEHGLRAQAQFAF